MKLSEVIRIQKIKSPTIELNELEICHDGDCLILFGIFSNYNPYWNLYHNVMLGREKSYISIWDYLARSGSYGDQLTLEVSHPEMDLDIACDITANNQELTFVFYKDKQLGKFTI